jgi:hypothetical protein
MAATLAAAIAAVIMVHRQMMITITIAAVVMVHREMMVAAVMRVRRRAHMAVATSRRMKSATMKSTTATVETTAAAAPVGRGHPAERNGDHANYCGKGNWPHDILRF